MSISNLFKDLDSRDGQERFDELLRNQGVRIERIVSHGHASEPGFWYDQNWDEWVLVLSGQAELEYEDRVVRLLPGEYAMIPAGHRHRVKSTSADPPTVWLAVHWPVREQAQDGAF